MFFTITSITLGILSLYLGFFTLYKFLRGYGMGENWAGLFPGHLKWLVAKKPYELLPPNKASFLKRIKLLLCSILFLIFAAFVFLLLYSNKIAG